LTGIAIAGFFASVVVWFRNDPDWPLLIIPGVLGLGGLWATTGCVIADARGITFKMPGRARFLAWNEITDVRTDKRGVIILLAGGRSLEIDTRIAARDDLLSKIKEKTRIDLAGAIL
jgi:PH (Pleckstrin Homology) domain-containing protein